MNEMVLFICMLSAGIGIPWVVTSNQGFSLSNEAVFGVDDRVLEWLRPASVYLQNHPRTSQSLIALSSLLMDAQYVLMVLAVARRRKVLHAVPFALFYVLRMLIQRLVFLPRLTESVWSSPGVPTLTIFYEQVHDYFPSGHVGIVLLCYLYHTKLKEQRTARLALFQVFFQAFVVMVTRTHYSVDVIGGVLLAYSVWSLTKNRIFPCKVRRRILKLIQRQPAQDLKCFLSD